MNTPSSSTMSRRQLLGMGAMTVAAFGGVAAIARSTAHDGHDHGDDKTAATPAASPAASPVANANVFVIETLDTYFSPKEFSIPADTDVILRVINHGRMQHDFVCEPLHVSSRRVNAGEEVDIELNAKAGRYQFSCSVPGHKIIGMVGTLTVK